jgi:cobalt-zinc-cadmium efflux system protein
MTSKNKTTCNHLDHKSTDCGKPTWRLWITMLLNFIITAVEIIGGLISGSLALISDAVHNLSDGIALIISYGAIQLGERPRTVKYTFGLKRAEILAAIINAGMLIIISFFLIKSSIQRLSHPEPVVGGIMLLVAVVGLVANIAGTMLLRKISADNLNLRAAYFHLFSDAISSLAVIIGAIFIMLLEIKWIDPILTILISIYIFREAWSIIMESVDVIMMASPKDYDVTALVDDLETIPEIQNMHHVHVWRLSDTDTHLEAHVQVEDMYLSQTVEIQNKIERALAGYSIHHVTLQFECGGCNSQNHV